MFTDTHCHIYKEYFDKIDVILDKALKNKVNRIINNADNIETSKEVLSLIERYSNMYGAIGIHPEHVDNYNKEDLEFIEKNLKNKKIIAIGEIGLDYHYTKENKKEQIEIFEQQLKLAEKYNKPVIVHSREATKDTIDTLKKYKVKGVIHSFSGSYETACIYIKMGFLLGVNGVITFKNSNIKEVYKSISLHNIVLETDSPYLAPTPYRGKKNEPANILVIAEFLASLYGESLSYLSEVTNENISRIFDK